MESKIELQLCANYTNSDLKSAIVNSLLCDFVIDKLQEVFKKYSDLDLYAIMQKYKGYIEESNNVTFSDIEEWQKNKINVYQDCLRLVVDLDNLLVGEEKINSGELIESISSECQDFTSLLVSINVTNNSIDFGILDLKDEFIDNLLNQLTLVDEGQFLSDLSTMKFDIVPLESTKFRNKFIEQKLKRAWCVVDNSNVALEKNFDELLDEVSDSHRKFYKISYATKDDSEKANSARKVYKFIGKLRNGLDRLEDDLTEANELRRQLTLHKKKLEEQKQVVLDRYKEIENPSEQESYLREVDSINFVAEEYFERIDEVNEAIEDISFEITERYKILDKVENALKVAIPSENEMKRYSGIIFKFEDLFVRLELGRSQHKDLGKDFLVAIDTAKRGILALSKIAQEGKDVFMRNNLLAAIFNSVNGIYDIVEEKNKSTELTNVKFVTTRLVKYSTINNALTKNLQTFRHVCNNIIRDISLTMGKPFSVNMALDVVDIIELAIRQIQDLVNKLNVNHLEQVRLLSDILNI